MRSCCCRVFSASHCVAAAFGRRRCEALQAWLVRRLAGASGGAGLHGAAAIVEVHSRTLEYVDAAAYDALLRVAVSFGEARWNGFYKLEASPPAPPRERRARMERWRREERRDERQAKNPTKKDVLAKIDGVDALVVGLTLGLLDTNAATTLTTR